MVERRNTPRKLEKLTMYVPQRKAQFNVQDRLRRLAKRKGHSVNHLVVEAICQYLQHLECEDQKPCATSVGNDARDGRTDRA